MDESKMASSAVKIQSRWRTKKTGESRSAAFFPCSRLCFSLFLTIASTATLRCVDLQLKQDTTERFGKIQSHLSPHLQEHLKQAFDGRSLIEQLHILKGLERQTPQEMSKALDAHAFWKTAWERIRFLPESMQPHIESVCQFMTAANRDAFVEMVEVMGDKAKVTEVVTALEEMPIFDDVGTPGWMLLPHVPFALRARLFALSSAEEEDETGRAEKIMGPEGKLQLLQMYFGAPVEEEDAEQIVSELEEKVAEAESQVQGAQIYAAAAAEGGPAALADSRPAGLVEPSADATDAASAAGSAESADAGTVPTAAAAPAEREPTAVAATAAASPAGDAEELQPAKAATAQENGAAAQAQDKDK